MDDGDTDYSARMGIVTRTLVALDIQDDRAAAAAMVWAECLIEAAHAAKLPIPVLKTYAVGGTPYFGFQVGPFASQVDCGFTAHDVHEVIRVLDRQGDLHLWVPVAALFRLFGLHRGDDYYFGLEGRETIGILIGGTRAQEYYGKTGREAIVSAIKSALTYYK